MTDRGMPNMIGPYQVIAKIDSGAMGTVYQAVREYESGAKSSHVIKVPNVLDKRHLLQFEKECTITLKMRHRNIVRASEMGTHDGVPFLVLDFIAGKNLLEVLRTIQRQRQDPWSFDAVAHVGRAVGSALDYAFHLAPDGVPLQIVHRDCSSKNVIVSGDGDVLLTDFGIAFAATKGTDLGDLKGTWRYMAPEHARNKNLGAWCDWFGLGTILWEMLEGRLFREDWDENQVRQAAIDGVVPPLTRPKIPQHLRDLTYGLLNPNFRDRMKLRVALPMLAGIDASDAIRQSMVLLFQGAVQKTGLSMAHPAALPELDETFAIARAAGLDRPRRLEVSTLPSLPRDQPPRGFEEPDGIVRPNHWSGTRRVRRAALVSEPSPPSALDLAATGSTSEPSSSPAALPPTASEMLQVPQPATPKPEERTVLERSGDPQPERAPATVLLSEREIFHDAARPRERAVTADDELEARPHDPAPPSTVSDRVEPETSPSMWRRFGMPAVLVGVVICGGAAVASFIAAPSPRAPSQSPPPAEAGRFASAAPVSAVEEDPGPELDAVSPAQGRVLVEPTEPVVAEAPEILPPPNLPAPVATVPSAPPTTSTPSTTSSEVTPSTRAPEIAPTAAPARAVRPKAIGTSQVRLRLWTAPQAEVKLGGKVYPMNYEQGHSLDVRVPAGRRKLQWRYPGDAAWRSRTLVLDPGGAVTVFVDKTDTRVVASSTERKP